MTENEKINGWTFEETVKTTGNLMEVENNMFKWDVLRHLRDFAENFKDELEQYRAVGTVEDLKSMKENGAFSGVELAQIACMQMKLKDYQSIGTIDEFKALKEKSVAKKPIRNDLRTCPSCGTYNEVIGKRRNTVAFDTVYCWHCGQAIEIKRE